MPTGIGVTTATGATGVTAITAGTGTGACVVTVTGVGRTVTGRAPPAGSIFGCQATVGAAVGTGTLVATTTMGGAVGSSTRPFQLPFALLPA